MVEKGAVISDAQCQRTALIEAHHLIQTRLTVMTLCKNGKKLQNYEFSNHNILCDAFLSLTPYCIYCMNAVKGGGALNGSSLTKKDFKMACLLDERIGCRVDGKSEQHRSEKPCFLIVDDDHQSVMSLSSMLEPFGSRVDAANCGSAAINCLSETWYDVVIADSEMKDSNGYELAHQVKDKFPKIRTIIMTEQNCSEIEQHIERTIADGCIIKPFSMDNLKTVLNNIR